MVGDMTAKAFMYCRTHSSNLFIEAEVGRCSRVSMTGNVGGGLVVDDVLVEVFFLKKRLILHSNIL